MRMGAAGSTPRRGCARGDAEEVEEEAGDADRGEDEEKSEGGEGVMDEDREGLIEKLASTGGKRGAAPVPMKGD
jgi:hypothetical protein